MTIDRLRVLARLMPDGELFRALNWRDHNPACRRIILGVESEVDRLLGFDGPPVFSREDDLHRAALKSSRNRLIREMMRKAAIDAIGKPGYEQFAAGIQSALIRQKETFWSFISMAAHYGSRRVLEIAFLRYRRLRRRLQVRTERKTFRKVIVSTATRPVAIVIRKDWSHAGFNAGKIVKELQNRSIPVTCVLTDHFNVKVPPPGWEWLSTVPTIAMPFDDEFRSAFEDARLLLDRLNPRSVLNLAGDSNLSAQAITYCCVKGRIPVHFYFSFIVYPLRTQTGQLTPSVLVVSKLEIPPEADRGGRKFTVVGSPVFDEPIPSIFQKRDDVFRILYFTKRSFPNREVITQIRDVLERAGRPFHLIVKPHPADTESDYRSVLSMLRQDQFTYVGGDQIDAVDRCIAESDVVITGPSNVIWSAARQTKPVIYLNFIDAGGGHYPEAYGRYMAAPFETAWHVSQVGEALGGIMNGKVDEARHRLLEKDVLCAPGAASRIADILVPIGG